MRDLLPCSKRSAAEMFPELLELLNTLSHPAMKSLAKAYLDDAFLMDAFFASAPPPRACTTLISVAFSSTPSRS